MIDTKHLVKVAMAWISIVYAVCYFGVALIPGIRPGFMMYGLHTSNFYMGQDFMTLGTFVTGLVIWNIIGVLAVWLFAALYNGIKK